MPIFQYRRDQRFVGEGLVSKMDKICNPMLGSMRSTLPVSTPPQGHVLKTHKRCDHTVGLDVGHTAVSPMVPVTVSRGSHSAVWHAEYTGVQTWTLISTNKQPGSLGVSQNSPRVMPNRTLRGSLGVLHNPVLSNPSRIAPRRRSP